MIGIDVGRTTLHIHNAETDETTTLPTSSAAHYLTSLPPSTIVLEPSGNYGLEIAELAHNAGHRVLLLTDNDTWALRRITRTQHKNDRLDARMLSTLATLATTLPETLRHALTPYETLRPVIQVRRTAYTARKLTQLAAALKTRAHQHPDPTLEQIRQTLKKLAADYMQSAIKAIPAEDRELLCSIPGVTPPLATLLWTYLAHPHRFRNADSAVSYVGLAPRNYPTSGTTTHPPRRKRPVAPLLATHLHMYALKVARQPHAYGRFGRTYQRVRPRGAKKALHAVKRQLVRVAYAILRTRTPYKEEAC